MLRSALALVPAAAAVAALLAASPAAAAQPIPEGPGGSYPAFTGEVWTPKPVRGVPVPPRHPFMAPNGRSNLHEDAYQTDTFRQNGPLGRGGVTRTSTFYAADCASITFDSKGRLVTACVGLAGVTLKLLEPRTLRELASFALPGRQPGSGAVGNPFQNFTGGGYFYLDEQDRAVVPTTTRELWVVKVTPEGGFARTRVIELEREIPDDDAIISALPDVTGRIWFATRRGIVGTISGEGDPVVQVARTGEPIGNSFAIDRDGGVVIVTDKALARWDARPDGTPEVSWREEYENDGTQKPGQSQAGSGTTPTLMGDDLVAITDNADPVKVVVLDRRPNPQGDRKVCEVPVFGKGASSTDQSLIGTDTSLVVENNFGYTGPQATELGRTTTPGLARIDVDRAARSCRVVWRSEETAPSVVPKLSLGSGLVYTYTKDARPDGGDPWWLTALDFRTGRTAFKAFSGEGLGFNNNYAPITVGPDGTAYVGTLGGMSSVRDVLPTPSVSEPSGSRARFARPALSRRCRDDRRGATFRVRGTGVRRVDFTLPGRSSVRRDVRPPFTASVPAGYGGRRVTARALMRDGARYALRTTVPRC